MENNKFPTVRFESKKTSKIYDNQVVKVTQYNARPVADVMMVSGFVNNNLKDYEKINKNEYRNKKTGEIKQYEHNEFRSEKSDKRSMRQLEKILLNNFSGADNELFVTLTTEEVVTDISKMKHNFKKFWNKLKKDYADIEYVYVFEMQQERESLHIHVMIKALSHKKLYISNTKITEYWGQGQTQTKRINAEPSFFKIDVEKEMSGKCKPIEVCNIDKLISYMCKYNTKENVPSGTRLYSTSRNIKAPDSTKIPYSNFKQEFNKDNSRIIDGYTTKIISNNTDEILNTIFKQRWIKNKQ